MGLLGSGFLSDSSRPLTALSLIDSLSTLASLGHWKQFRDAVIFIVHHVHFDIDLRVNVFETNIRLLGGLLAAHLVCVDTSLDSNVDGYSDGLLVLANDLGKRLLRAFDHGGDLPYAWVNLRHGVSKDEVTESCVAEAGTLVLEFGMLSYLTGDDRFFASAKRSVMRLWKMRSSIDLLGNSFDIKTRRWINDNAGIGSGADSFYEYLFKAYILFGDRDFLDIYTVAYGSITKYLKSGPWYMEASMKYGQHTHVQFNSLQAFWPGLQVLTGDVSDAMHSHAAFFSIWSKYGCLPERYLLHSQELHFTERYYPLRPELIESTYFLHRATKNALYLDIGEYMFWSLSNRTRVANGFASVRDVATGELEDRMPSFFLAETCKFAFVLVVLLFRYLYLLFDDSNFVHKRNYIFTTEGHMFPVLVGVHQKFGNHQRNSLGKYSKFPKQLLTCRNPSLPYFTSRVRIVVELVLLDVEKSDLSYFPVPREIFAHRVFDCCC